MNLFITSIMRFSIICLICAVTFSLQLAYADGNIDSTNKYAWSENSSWQNFNPTHGGVTINDTFFTGYAWAENIGWIKLGSGSGPYDNNSSSNWGVNNNNGYLSGYAWSENVGWINFNPTHS